MIVIRRKALVLIAMSAVLAAACGLVAGSPPSRSSPPRRASAPAPATGPLRVHPKNPRYFTDGSGKAIYLTGSHTWNGLYDAFWPLDYAAYLDFLVQHNHNFTKFRAWDSRLLYGPLYYTRTGPGNAADGLPKLDLNKFDQAHFDRLRERVIAARDKGVYVMIMLFETEELNGDPRLSKPDRSNTWSEISPSGWRYHPYNKLNNIQGVDGGNADNTAPATTETLANPAITRLREAYIRKIVDTVNDLDNVLFEIANETHNIKSDSKNVRYSGSQNDPYGPIVPNDSAWSYHMIDFIHEYEKTKPKQHPVVMTMPLSTSNNSLFESKAEAISPGGKGYQNPWASDGKKVVLTDPDHCGWIEWRGTRAWAWKSFASGLNPIPLDSLPTSIKGNNAGGWGGGDMREMIETRNALGDTRAYAMRMDLAAMVPREDLTSTKYCLANPGSEYLVYQPAGGDFSINLVAGKYAYEWFNPAAGNVAGTGSVTAAGGSQRFTPPFAGDAVLYLKAVATAQ